jgi:unsaturated chondroitin disaccharide hydrolase
MNIDIKLTAASLAGQISKVAELAAIKAFALDKAWDPARGTPVFTEAGKYTTRGWTEWTQGFQYGIPLLAFDISSDKPALELGRKRTMDLMLPHVTHIGVHDHGFNNLSTYGNLARLASEGRFSPPDGEIGQYLQAIKCSGAVQAARWQGINVNNKPSPHAADVSTLGYIYSFNGPHSLFIDTMRTCRILSAAWKLGHVLVHENDRRADLLKRTVLHGLATSQYIVFHGDSTHAYDVRGRTAHEGVFNRNDGCFRSRATQQGYSPFSTWTRGLAWAILGYAEELEFFTDIPSKRFKEATTLDKDTVVKAFATAAIDTAEHYIHDVTAADGIPYWDDGAPGLAKLGDWQSKPADPFNDHEPVDASAAAIAAQGLLRLGSLLGAKGKKYTQAGLTVARTLFAEPYLSTNPKHQGLLLHSIYHRPNNWDYIPKGAKTPRGESALWGDYHLIELAVYLDRLNTKRPYHTFFAGL